MTAEEKYPVLIGHYSGGRRRLHSLVEVADFISGYGRNEDLLITLRDWSPFTDTCGVYVDFAADPEYREELMKVLAPLQVECERFDTMVEFLDGAEKPLNIKNLAELKCTIKLDVEIKAIPHAYHPDIDDLVRFVCWCWGKSGLFTQPSFPDPVQLTWREIHPCHARERSLLCMLQRCNAWPQDLA